MSRLTTSSDSERKSEGMAGLAKGLAILEGFEKSRPRMTISQAAEFAGLSPSAARRCLLTLVEAGYLFHDGKYFQPTPRMMRISAAYMEASPLGLHAQPFLDEARDALDESVSLAVLDGKDCLFVARASASQIVSTDIAVGVHLPVHASATGRVLLSAMEDDEVREFLELHPAERRTPLTVINIDALMQIVQNARKADYAVSSEELELGMHSLAVPVRDSRAACVGAISVSAFTGRGTLEELLDKSLPVLKKAAQGFGRIL